MSQPHHYDVLDTLEVGFDRVIGGLDGLRRDMKDGMRRGEG